MDGKKFKFWFQCHTCCMQHVLQAAQGNTIYVILYAARPELGRDVGSRGGFSGHFKRETQHGRTTTMPAGQRFWHWISTGWAGTGRGNWIPEQAQTLHRGYPSLSLPPSLCAAVVCVDDWFHGKVDFNQQMFMQFFACPFFLFFLPRFFLSFASSRCGRLGVCRLTRIMTLSLFGALYRSSWGET